MLSLHHLSCSSRVSENDIESEGAVALAEALKVNQTMRSIE